MVAFLQVSSSPKVNPSSNLLLLLVLCAGLLLLVQQRNWGENWKLLLVQRNWGGNERNLNNERRTWIRPHNYIWTEVQGQTGKGKHDDEPVCDKKVRRAYEQLPVRNVTYGRWLGKDCVGLFFFNILILGMHFWGVGRENIKKMGQKWSLFYAFRWWSWSWSWSWVCFDIWSLKPVEGSKTPGLTITRGDIREIEIMSILKEEKNLHCEEFFEWKFG